MLFGRWRRQRGDAGEAAAADYLTDLGYEILDRNISLAGGEIDLIARDGETIVFVEVKLRQSSTLGDGTESIGLNKCRHLARAAQAYLQSRKLPDSNLRADVISICLHDPPAERFTHHIGCLDLASAQRPEGRWRN